MRVHNVRFGFATNSSSTHSLIVVNPGRDVPERDVEVNDLGKGPEYAFGWEFFTASEPETKRAYLAINLARQLRGSLGPSLAEACVRALIPDLGAIDLENSSVDHQSMFGLPRGWDGAAVHEGFARELAELFAREDVVVLGGNDNADHEHYLDDGSAVGLHGVLRPGRNLVARKEPAGYWVLFDRRTGTKVRLDLRDLTTPAPTRTDRPELVDLKITDYCPYGCAHCYMASTMAGTHADTGRLRGIIDALSALEVFEVAIGGGEPTLHPHFVPILEHARGEGVVPNFTTRNLAWMRDPGAARAICDAVGGFAFSTERAEDVRRLAALRESYDITAPTMVQVVVGAMPRYAFEGILREAHDAQLGVTLLGYKHVGRGATHAPHKDADSWLESVKRLAAAGTLPSLGIDTALAGASEQALTDAGVPRWLYSMREGAFSMYIDAVRDVAGPSSYCDESEFRPLTAKYELEHEIAEIFEGFGSGMQR